MQRAKAIKGARRRSGPPVHEHLKAIILLSGSVRSAAFGAAIGRSVLDLPIASGRTLLQCWHEAAIGLAGFLGVSGLPLRVIIDGRSAAPTLPLADERTSLSVERDPLEYRGTAGVLKDICGNYQPDDYVIVANAGQLLVESLSTLVDELASAGSAVALISHLDGTPGGLTLLRCGALESVASVGFVDLKEQALSQIATEQHIEVIEREQPSGLAFRTAADYIAALRSYHTLRSVHNGDPAQPVEDCRRVFSLVEDPASVDNRAHIHDSVVLRGGWVGKDAAVVRSVVSPGGVVQRGGMIVDELVRPNATNKEPSWRQR